MFEARIRPMEQYNIDLERLLAIEAAKRLVLDSIYFSDQRRYAELGAVFAEAGELYRPTADTVLIGSQAIAEAYARTPPNRITRHLITNQRADVLGNHEIEVHSYALVYVSEEGERSVDRFGAPVSRCLVGEFHDLCVCRNGTWRIRRRRAEFVMQALPQP